MRNSYDKNNPLLINSVVCFVDILGFSSMIRNACLNNQGNQLLQRLKSAIENNIESLKPIYDRYSNLKMFTDNIVIGVPLNGDGESELGGIFMGLASYQLNLALEGFFVRGGLTVGPYYGDDEISFGIPIINAHDIESKISNTPRIVLDPLVVDMVRNHLNYYSNTQFAPQFRDLLVDIDGHWFINYLEAVFAYGDNVDYNEALHVLYKHKNIVVNKMSESAGSSKILSKYIWVANYHNYFCKMRFPQYQELIISHNQGFGQYRTIW